jgi:hypothetical protein
LIADIASALAMLGGELRGWDTTDAAVRPDLVVVASPSSNLLTRLRERFEPLLVQTFVAELAVEALDVGVLRRLACVVEQVPHAATVALAGYLCDIVWPHEGVIDIVQGEDMGMRSRLRAEISSVPGSSIRVSRSTRLMTLV